MKAEGGGLIYIIISIVFLIISAYQKNKKKKEATISQEATDETPAPPHNTWQKELEDIFGPVSSTPEVATVPSHPPVENPVVHKAEPERVERVSREVKSTTHTDHRNNIPSGFLVEEEYEMAAVDLDDFDLAKAIIYSEILDRKYI